MAKSTPTPDSETSCGLSVALSTRTSVPILLPTTVGVNVTVIVQLVAPTKLPPQLLLAPKSPLGLIEDMTSVPLPVVVRVMDCPEVVPPTD